MALSSDKKKCIPKRCGLRETVTAEGTCKPCEDYTILSEDGLSCEPKECKVDEKIIDTIPTRN